MASKDDRIWFRASDDLAERIGDHESQHPDLDSQSAAVRDLVETGLEHESSPVGTLRPYILDAAVHLILVAAAVVVAGAGTDILADVYALQIGGVLVAVAGGVIAAFELAHRLTTTTPTNPFSGENA